jgi:hypothetical protein
MENNEIVQKTNKMGLILGVMVAIIVIGVGAFFLLNKDDAKKEEEKTNDPKKEETTENAESNGYKDSDFFRETSVKVWEDYYIDYDLEGPEGDLIAKIVGDDIVLTFNETSWTVKNTKAKYLYTENDGHQTMAGIVFFIGQDGYLYIVDYSFDETLGDVETLTFKKIDTKSKVLEFIINDNLKVEAGELVEVLLDSGEKVLIETGDLR